MDGPLLAQLNYITECENLELGIKSGTGTIQRIVIVCIDNDRSFVNEL